MKAQTAELPLRHPNDLYNIHELAMRLAGEAGLSPLAQIRFASGVAQACDAHTGADHTIRIGIYHEEGILIWRGNIGPSGETIEKKIDLSTGNWMKDTSALKEQDKKSSSLESRYNDMKQFTFALSHDLKNSLTKLKLALSLVEEEDMPPLIGNYIKIIHRSAERLEETMLGLNQIIEFGHSSPANIKSVALEKVFNDVADEFAESLASVDASIITDFGNLKEICFVEVYLKSIFSNLISNAVKYAIPGRALELGIIGHRSDGEAVLVFTDNGQGIDLGKFGHKLFQPFSRFSNNTAGSGNGLYIIRNMVERNGGHIEVESRPGKGATFRILLQEYAAGEECLTIPKGLV